MIISHTHRYVFVELPRTGSTAISRELRALYAGERILKKHSTYRDFLRIASEDEKGYFAFSCIRNPLDDAVSHYFKLKTDHHSRFSDPVRRQYRLSNKGADQYRRSGGAPESAKPARRSLFERLDNRRYNYIKRRDADFERFFLRFHWLPHDTWSRLSHEQLDYVIRFEDLAGGFAEALRRIGLDQVRPLPVTNRTGGKADSYIAYYTPRTIPRAKRVFGPYMRRWGYQFPSSWGDDPVPQWVELAYSALAVPRVTYWQYLRRG